MRSPTPETKKLRRNTDPSSSHEGAEIIAPKKARRIDQVETHLSTRFDQWIAGWDLCSQSVGGREGLRRLRELRTRMIGERNLFVIEQQFIAGESYYRMTMSPVEQLEIPYPTGDTE